MEEEAPSQRSVAELAGKFKGSSEPNDTPANPTDKPVRRRPPRSLQLPKKQPDEQETPSVTSPLPGKAKRNSALIEKLQANLVLSPTALTPSPKSPGFRLLPPAFTPPSPSSAPVNALTSPSAVTTSSPVTASPLTEEEGPTSFEEPPTAAEGSILTSINKNRARHSIRRRPPSRRHRKSSSGEEVGEGKDGADTPLCTPSESENKTAEDEEGGGGGFKKDDREDVKNKTETEALTCPEKSNKDKQSTTNAKTQEEQEKEKEGDEVSSEKMDDKNPEENSTEKKEDHPEGATNKEEKNEESCSSR